MYNIALCPWMFSDHAVYHVLILLLLLSPHPFQELCSKKSYLIASSSFLLLFFFFLFHSFFFLIPSIARGIDSLSWTGVECSIANFKIDKRIGRGQFSVVYKAICLSDNRLVALKKVQVRLPFNVAYIMTLEGERVNGAWPSYGWHTPFIFLSCMLLAPNTAKSFIF